MLIFMLILQYTIHYAWCTSIPANSIYSIATLVYYIEGYEVSRTLILTPIFLIIKYFRYFLKHFPSFIERRTVHSSMCEANSISNLGGAIYNTEEYLMLLCEEFSFFIIVPPLSI